MALDTEFDSPYASRRTTRGSCSLRNDIIQWRIKERRDEDNSRLRERASPDHDGTVGLYPVTLETLTRVPWMFVTR